MNLKRIVPTVTLLAACVFASACSPSVAADPVEPTHTSPAPLAPEFQGIGHWLNGPPQALSQLRGKVVLVEFWATWCPPCRSTLQWLGEVKKKYADRVEVVALAVESPEKEARELAAQVGGDLRWAFATEASGRAFGDITAVPTLFLFGADGKTARVLYGAPPDLHEQVGKAIEGLLR